MDGCSQQPTCDDIEQKEKKSQRLWTYEEEKAFAEALKKCKMSGFKAENGWKPGYALFLLNEMQKSFPDTDLKHHPHYLSKMKAWKHEYGFLQSILGKSGIGWDDENKVVQCTPEIWLQNAQAWSGMKGKRNQVWTFYDDWCEIFGKDRATGKGAKDLRDAASKFLPEPLMKATENSFNEEEVAGNDMTLGDEIGDSSNTSRKRAKTGPISQSSEMDSYFVDTIDKVFNKAIDKLPSFVPPETTKVDYLSNIHGRMLKFPNISLRDKVTVGTKLAKDLDLCKYFLSLPDDAAEEFVVQQLDLYRPSYGL